MKCVFENCVSTDEGALVSSGDNELYVEKTLFHMCSSKTKCAGLKKTKGVLTMNCCVFDQCHGQNKDTHTLGTAMGAIDCCVLWNYITFFRCWTQATIFADNTYGFLRGSADVKDANSSFCYSAGGGVVGSYYTVKTGALIRYLQAVDGKDCDPIEMRNTNQAIDYMNIVNNLFDYYFLYASECALNVSHGCFFKNNRNNNQGTVYLHECVSDQHTSATILESISTTRFIMRECLFSSLFTLRDDYIPFFPITFLAYFLVENL